MLWLVILIFFAILAAFASMAYRAEAKRATLGEHEKNMLPQDD